MPGHHLTLNNTFIYNNRIYEVIRMIFPLEALVKFSGNVYEITVAASRRAFQMSKIEDPSIDANDGKVVSLAASQLFNEKVQYRIEKQ